MADNRTIRGARPPRRGGYSLAELMIAVAILGVGLIMAAALFPAAIKQNESSFNDTVGVLICRNALDLAKVRLTNPIKEISGATLSMTPGTFVDVTDPNQQCFGPLDQLYVDPNSLMGFRLLARQVTAGVNDYELLAVAYGKIDAANQVHSDIVTGDIPPGPPPTTLNITSANGQRAKKGSPFVFVTGDDGARTIMAVTGTTLTLSGTATSGPNRNGYVFYETLSDGTPLNYQSSPAISFMQTRTALREQ